MQRSLILTVLGPDRKGLVRSLADVVSAHDGSWQESQMARLAGHFAGVLRVVCAPGVQEALKADLKALETGDLKITIVDDLSEGMPELRTVEISITGHDEPGIVKRVFARLSDLGVNVEDLQTSLESAPMAGHLLFCARGTVSLPDGLELPEMTDALEEVGSDLTIDIH